MSVAQEGSASQERCQVALERRLPHHLVPRCPLTGCGALLDDDLNLRSVAAGERAEPLGGSWVDWALGTMYQTLSAALIAGTGDVAAVAALGGMPGGRERDDVEGETEGGRRRPRVRERADRHVTMVALA